MLSMMTYVVSENKYSEYIPYALIKTIRCDTSPGTDFGADFLRNVGWGTHNEK